MRMYLFKRRGTGTTILRKNLISTMAVYALAPCFIILRNENMNFFHSINTPQDHINGTIPVYTWLSFSFNHRRAWYIFTQMHMYLFKPCGTGAIIFRKNLISTLDGNALAPCITILS